MTKCSDCGQEMLSADSCTFKKIKINGKIYDRLTEEFFEGDKRCHDCGIKKMQGNIHHYGCDMERCPRCGLQLISCDCNKQAVISEK